MTVERPSGPFRLGDRVQLTGPKNRLHTITLREDGELHTHHGVLKHAALVGLPDGSVVSNSGGHEYLALRPLLRDFVMSMPRGAAIVYPKDAAQIIAQADVFPGSRRRRGRCRVRCAGALAAARDRRRRATGLVRAPRGVRGRRAGERRDVPRPRAPELGASWSATWSRSCRMPSPRHPSTASCSTCSLRGSASTSSPMRCTPGGVVLCYVATATQLSRVAEYIRAHGALHRARRERDDGARLARRGTRRPSRPPHGGAHRLPAVGPAPRAGRRAARAEAPARSKSSYGDEDVELWTPGAVGDRQITDKNLRKRVREAERAADGARTRGARHGRRRRSRVVE